MTNERIGTIRRCLGIVTSAAIVVTGLCLMGACAKIYFTGDHVFTREIAGSALYDLRWLLLACGVLILANLCLPKAVEKAKTEKQTGMILKRMQERTDLDGCDEALLSQINAQRNLRKRDHVLTAVLTAVGGLVFLIYALQSGSFHQSEINTSMLRAMRVLFPCVLIPMLFAIPAQRRAAASMEAEIDLLKQVGKKKSAYPEPQNLRCPIATKVIFILAVVLLIYGYLSGGTVDVLTKAINICTECVGLG